MVTLIQLVSEQTMQNLLPVMALHPSRVVHVRSARQGMAERSDYIRRACKELIRTHPAYRDLAVEWMPDVEIPEESPAVESSQFIMNQLLRTYPQAVVNYTGGTKMMSIGAFQALSQAGQAPGLYCDTQAQRFCLTQDYGTLPSFAQLATHLSVEVMLAAHGLSADRLCAAKPQEGGLAYAQEMACLWRDHEEEMSRLGEKIRRIVYPDGRNLIRKSQIEQCLAAGLPKPENAIETRAYEVFMADGIVQKGSSIYSFVVRTRGNDALLRETDELCKKIIGGWYELYMSSCMQASGRFLDLRVNVQSRDPKEQYLGETDVMGIDAQALALTFVSCKNTDEHIKPLEHVFSMRQRSLDFGGAFCKSVLSVRKFKSPQKKAQIEQACRVARVRLLEGFPERFEV
ncbi:MAG: DUF1887 family CARF protein [Lentisphaerota bacterium]